MNRCSFYQVEWELVSCYCIWTFHVEDGPPATASGVEIVEFLRQQTTDDLIALGGNFFAVNDGHVLPTNPADIYASADHNRVELMIGCNSDEGCMLLPLFLSLFGIKVDQLDVNIARMFITGFLFSLFSAPQAKEVAGTVVAQYLDNLDSKASPEVIQRTLIEFIGDALIVAPTIRTANFHSRWYILTIFLYRRSCEVFW